jgi:hypothetical protein
MKTKFTLTFRRLFPRNSGDNGGLTMGDYISREAAIALTDQHCFESCYDAEWMEESLKDIPAADVRTVVRGKDIRNTVKDHHCEFKCSICGEEIVEHWGEDFNFCPYCGAKVP